MTHDNLEPGYVLTQIDSTNPNTVTKDWLMHGT